jgi:hypothetical protein
MSNEYDTKIFIEKSLIVHGTEYDYSEIKFLFDILVDTNNKILNLFTKHMINGLKKL